MRTKHLLLILLLSMLMLSKLTAQQNAYNPSAISNTTPHSKYFQGECGFAPTQAQIDALEQNPDYQNALRQFMDNYHNRALQPITYVPIKAHILRTTGGTGGLTVAQLNAAITNMNNYYINANMQFYLCDGINFIDDNTYYDFNQTQEAALHGANGVANLINIYFCNTVTSSGGNPLCGYAYFPGGPDVILMANSCTTNGSTLPHEMGHFFSLYHTHGTTNGTLTDEFVNGTNCATNGDRVCDTPADPQLGNANVNASCVYNGTAPYTSGGGVDANGDPFAPNPNNIMSYARKACRNFFSPGQYARIYAAYSTSRSYFTCPTFNVDFTATPTNSCSAPTTVNFTDASVGATAWQWDVDGDNIVDYTTQNPSHTYTTAGSYDVRLTISNGSDTILTTKTFYVNVGSSNNIPYSEDFESFTVATNATGLANGWETTPSNTTTAYRWNPDEGGTPSPTGPNVDNTLGTALGNYMFTEATGSNPGDTAELISPCINLNSSNPELSFAYHMYTANVAQMGDLHVDIFAGGAWTNDITPVISGLQHPNQADPWTIRTVDLTAYAGQSVRIRFRGIRGSGFASDMAVDDINIIDNPSAPFISFVNASTTQAEAATSGTTGCRGYVDINIPLQIATAPTGNAVVTFNAAGSANGTYDYQILTPTVTFPNGSTANQNLQIRVLDDAAEEAIENLVLTYTISGATDAVAGATNQSHTLTINDNDMLPSDFAGNANVATAIASTQLYFGPNETVYYYDGSNNIMAMLQNNSGHDYGCTTVQIDRTGTGSIPYDHANVLYNAASKTFVVTPANNNAAGQYDITLYYSSAEVTGWEAASGNARANLDIRKTGGPSANITPGSPNGNGATNYNGAGTNRVVYDATEFAVTSTFNTGFSGFVVGQPPAPALLNVDISELLGEKISPQHNQLSWSTYSENNALHFEIERSLDGLNFEKIAIVKATGTSSVEQAYTYEDQEAATRDLCYYRLRQVNLNGDYQYTNVISIEGSEWKVNNISIYPNPSKGVFNLLFESQSDATIPLKIYNSIGKLVYNINIQPTVGKNNAAIDLSALPAGMYQLQIQQGDLPYIRKIVKY